MSNTTTPEGAKELKPCPFCGSNDINGHIEIYGPMRGLHYSKCNGCSTRSGYAENVDLATETWNQRVSAPQPVGEEPAAPDSAAGGEEADIKLLAEKYAQEHNYGGVFNLIAKTFEDAYKLGRATSTTAPVWVREILEQISVECGRLNQPEMRSLFIIQSIVNKAQKRLSQSRLRTVEEVLEWVKAGNMGHAVEYLLMESDIRSLYQYITSLK